MKTTISIWFCLLIVVGAQAQTTIRARQVSNKNVSVDVNISSKKNDDTKKTTTPTMNNSTIPPDTAARPAVLQPGSYDGPAKMYVNNYFKMAEAARASLDKHAFNAVSSKIGQMETSVKNIKAKDANYNTANMEAEIKQLTEELDKTYTQNQETSKGNKDKLANMIKLNQRMDDFFDISEFSIHTLENATKELEDWKARAAYFLTVKEDIATLKADKDYGVKYNRRIERMKMSLNATLERFIERTGRILSTSTGETGGNWQNCYYDMQGIQVYWDAATKVFPEEPKFREAYDKITAQVNLYGSLDNIHAKTQKNKSIKIKDTKMPPAVSKDPVLEKALIDGFNKKYSKEYEGEAIKAVLLQSEWVTERNQLTSIVTGRARQGAVIYKGQNGKCYLVSSIYLFQEYIGGSFQQNNTIVFNALGGQEMLCENVK